jgi:hypothetical protein
VLKDEDAVVPFTLTVRDAWLSTNEHPALAPFVTGAKAPHAVTVRVLGVRNYGELLRVKEYLQEAPGVARVVQVQLSDAQGTVSLFLSGGIENVSRALQGRDFGSFSTSTESVGEDSITLRIVER